jgi:hypothetical protein
MMTRWQFSGLAVGAAALLFTARPAQAQVWFGPPVVAPVVRPAPVVVTSASTWAGPTWVAASPAVVGPTWVAPAPVVVQPGWRSGPYWSPRRAARVARRTGGYTVAWGPRGGTAVVGRGW